MGLTLEQMTNGLTPDHDLVFPARPEDPEMRESTSVWLFEESGAFGFPRIGIEAEARAWDARGYQANLALGGGRVLVGRGQGPGPSPFGPDGRPTILGAGPLVFRCLEPFRRWAMTLIETVLDRLEGEQRGLDGGERFAALRPVLVGEPSEGGYAALAGRCQNVTSGPNRFTYRGR